MNKTDRKIYMRNYYLANKQKLLDYSKEWQRNNPDSVDPQLRSANRKRYYQNHKEREIARIKDYNQRNKQHILAQKKEYYQKNKERIKARANERYRLKKNLKLNAQNNQNENE